MRTLLRGGCVLTLGAKTPNFARADVLIEDDRVAEVGPGLRVRDAEQVDAADAIVMPGFVDSHRHVKRSLFRNVRAKSPSGNGAGSGPPPDELLEAEGVYAATLIGLLGAAEAGITTVVDWSGLALDDDRSRAALEAHADAGVRGVFVGSSKDDAAPAAEALERLRGGAGPMTTLAFGSSLGSVEGWAAYRDLGLRIHVHGGGPGPGAVADAAGKGVLDEDVTLIHASELSDADLEAIASSGAGVTMAPSSRMAGGIGSPPIQQLIDRDIRPGLGVDDDVAAPGDMFAQMRATISVQHATVFDRKLAGKAGLPKLMNTRNVIRYATSDGARVAGLSGVTGSLEPGRQADVIVLRTDRPNIYPINDPIGAVVWGMDTSNLDWVFAGGRVLMRDGVLQADVERARGMAVSALDRMGAGGGR